MRGAPTLRFLVGLLLPVLGTMLLLRTSSVLRNSVRTSKTDDTADRLHRLEQSVQRVQAVLQSASRALSVDTELASKSPSIELLRSSPPPPAASAVAGKTATRADAAAGVARSVGEFGSASFLMAQHEPIATVGAHSVHDAQRLLKSLLGLARLLGRTLVLPATLCDCKTAHADAHADAMLSNTLSGFVGEAVAPFGCPLRGPLASMLHLEAWRDARVRKMLRPANLLTRDPAAVPRELRSSHVRVLLPDAMSDGETRYALRSYSDTRLLEIERASQAYCGWDARHDKKSEGPAFDAWADALLQPTEAFLASWRDVTLRSPTALVPCQHFHGGAGEVQRFTNIGVCYRPRGRANAALAKACHARIWTRTKSPVITD